MTYSGRADGKDDNIGDWSDGDGDARVTHGGANVEGVVADSFFWRFQVVEWLHDHEHVVNAWKRPNQIKI